jgi:hypothetical protein
LAKDAEKKKKKQITEPQGVAVVSKKLTIFENLITTGVEWFLFLFFFQS